MGCLFESITKLILVLLVFIGLGSLVIAIFIDFHLAATGGKPYFFDPEKIDSYDKPMLADFEKKLQENYEENQFEFQNLEDYIPHLPDKDRFKIKFVTDTEVSISGSYDKGWKSSSSVDYTDHENTQYISELGWTRNSIEDLRNRLANVNCTSFEKKDGFRAGFIDEKSGTYYYRFSTYDSDAKQSEILDSCLLRYYKNDIFFEYKGSGRGPDCLKSKNGEGFDDRNYVQKWIDIIKQGEIKRPND